MFGLCQPSNAAGKSTLINIIAGVVNKSEGTVRIWDRATSTMRRATPDPRWAWCRREIVADVFPPRAEALEVQAGFYMACSPMSAALTNCWRRWACRTRPTPMSAPCPAGMKRRLMAAKALSTIRPC